jgi:integrase
MEKVPQKLPTYITGDHFAAIYQACEEPKFPTNLPYPTADWWRALLVTGYMTGWRISELLALQRVDLDLDQETAITRAEDNKGKRDEVVKLHPVKGKRDEVVKLHPVVVEHLRKIVSFDPVVFPGSTTRRRCTSSLP